MINVPLVQFKCQVCKSDFWVQTKPGTISCPNPECQHTWAPQRAIAVLERGKVIEFQIPDVGPKTQSLKD